MQDFKKSRKSKYSRIKSNVKVLAKPQKEFTLKGHDDNRRGLQLNCLGGKNDSLSSCIVTMLKLSQWQPLLSVCNSAFRAKNILIHLQKELNKIVAA